MALADSSLRLSRAQERNDRTVRGRGGKNNNCSSTMSTIRVHSAGFIAIELRDMKDARSDNVMG